MEERELKRGFRNGWILVLLLLALIAAWTAFTIWTNRDEVPPHFVPGGRDFVPGESPYGMGYRTPDPGPQEE
jgi:hypothetical protein